MEPSTINGVRSKLEMERNGFAPMRHAKLLPESMQVGEGIKFLVRRIIFSVRPTGQRVRRIIFSVRPTGQRIKPIHGFQDFCKIHEQLIIETIFGITFAEIHGYRRRQIVDKCVTGATKYYNVLCPAYNFLCSSHGAAHTANPWKYGKN